VKSSQTVYEPKNAKIDTAKLNLKVRNICSKPLLKLKNANNKQCFETDYLGQNVINLHQLKVAQNVAILWLLLSFQQKS
jgi:hypothetical protein